MINHLTIPKMPDYYKGSTLFLYEEKTRDLRLNFPILFFVLKILELPVKSILKLNFSCKIIFYHHVITT